jgi:hypothetical protein
MAKEDLETDHPARKTKSINSRLPIGISASEWAPLGNFSIPRIQDYLLLIPPNHSGHSICVANGGQKEGEGGDYFS